MRFRCSEVRTTVQVFCDGTNLPSTLKDDGKSGLTLQFDTEMDLLLVIRKVGGRTGFVCIPESAISGIIPHPEALSQLFSQTMAPAPEAPPIVEAPKVPEIDLSAPMPTEAPENYPEEKPRTKSKK